VLRVTFKGHTRESNSLYGPFSFKKFKCIILFSEFISSYFIIIIKNFFWNLPKLGKVKLPSLGKFPKNFFTFPNFEKNRFTSLVIWYVIRFLKWLILIHFSFMNQFFYTSAVCLGYWDGVVHESRVYFIPTSNILCTYVK